MNDFDPYTLLGVSRDASAKDIQKTYRKASIKYHPDRAGDDDKEAAEMFMKLKRARDVLESDQLRQAYDRGGWPMVDRVEEHIKRVEQHVSQCEPMMIDNIVTLQQIYNKEKITIGTKVPTINDAGITTYEPFSVEIELANEGRIVAQGVGQKKPDHVPGDIVIQIRLAPTCLSFEPSISNFSLRGDDLIYTAKLDLRNLMGKYNVHIPHPSGQNYEITGKYQFNEKSDADNVLIFPGLGLKGERTGNMIVKLEADLSQLKSVSTDVKEQICTAIISQFGPLEVCKDTKDITVSARTPQQMRNQNIPPEMAQLISMMGGGGGMPGMPGMPGMGGMPEGMTIQGGNSEDCVIC
jgi:DnaJ-class molecular chaperone